MIGHHHHHHGHGHHHGVSADPSEKGERKLWWAVGANMLLTLAQVGGGIISGSLALVADALHNFSDAASLLLALIAIRIGRRPPDEFKTFGYRRAETVAALINLTALMIIGIYLISEAVQRFFAPEPISGWTVVIVAGLALAVDICTAALTWAQSKHSLNIKAAFLHNLTDAAASVGVIISGTLILLYGWVWIDALMTLVIAGYVLWHGARAMPEVINLLMEGTPAHIDIADVIAAMEDDKEVQGVHHVHIWQPDEQKTALEAHVLIDESAPMDQIKARLKAMLAARFDITHSTLEFENTRCAPCGSC